MRSVVGKAAQGSLRDRLLTRSQPTRPTGLIVTSFASEMPVHVQGNAVSVPVAQWLGEQLAAGQTCEKVFTPTTDGAHNGAYGGPREQAVYLSGLPEGPYLPTSLEDFTLHDAEPLSLRAAKGFATRYAKSKLRISLPPSQARSSRHTGRGPAKAS